MLELTPKTLRGVGIDYPKPDTIGPDRLANAVAARHRFGAPVVVVDFGTAVTFDVVNRAGNYAGGIIAPGLAAMTDYLHEKTALLPRIKIREIKTSIGKSTEQAMLVGAVHGYRGLVRELIARIEARIESEATAGRRHGRLREVDRVQTAGDFRRGTEFDAGRVAAGVGSPKSQVQCPKSSIARSLTLDFRLWALDYKFPVLCRAAADNIRFI